MEIRRIGLLDEVFPEDYLKLGNGGVVRSLRELALALEAMSDKDFRFYVYANHNDFAGWIMEAYWDEKLAGKVLSTRSRAKTVKILKKALARAEKERRDEKKIRGKKDILRQIGEME
jgi:hypothetical protein